MSSVDVLNEALRLDPRAVRSVFSTRVPCNPELADAALVANRDGTSQLGAIGIVNTVLRANALPLVAAVYQLVSVGDGQLASEPVLIKFEEWGDERLVGESKPETSPLETPQAEQHGLDSDPDHEVGDLQDALREAWRVLTPLQRDAEVEELTRQDWWAIDEDEDDEEEDDDEVQPQED